MRDQKRKGPNARQMAMLRLLASIAPRGYSELHEAPPETNIGGHCLTFEELLGLARRGLTARRHGLHFITDTGRALVASV